MSLVVDGVTHRFAGTHTDVLHSVSFEVQAGESLAIMAPSGSGKTTLLAIVGLLIEPTRGRVLYQGRPRTVTDAPAMLGREVNWVLQGVNLLPRRTVLDNVVLPVVAHGGARAPAEKRALELLDALGVISLAHQRARLISGGQAQRVAIARALVSRPSLVLADEPTASLDTHNAEMVMSQLVSVLHDTTLLVATHDPSVAGLMSRTLHLAEMNADQGEGS